MTPAILAALGFLAPLVEEVVLSAIRDAVELTDEERAARVDKLLEEVEARQDDAARHEAAGDHRKALRAERKAARAQAKADRIGHMRTLFSPPPTPTLLPIPAAVATAGAQAAMWEEVQRIAHSFSLRSFSFPVDLRPPCCWRCTPGYQLMLVCPGCGNKRCARASDHRVACTQSNEPGQPGSVYSRKRSP